MISQAELVRLSAMTNDEFARTLVPSGKMTVAEIGRLRVVSEDIKRAVVEFARNNSTQAAVKDGTLGKLAWLERVCRRAYVRYMLPRILKAHPLLTRYGAKMLAHQDFDRRWRPENY